MAARANSDRPAPSAGQDDLWSSTLATHTPFLLARARAVVVRACNEALRPLSLNVRTFSLLWLSTESLAPTQRQLSEFLDLDPSQIVALIDDLEAHGLVQRRANPADRRSRQIVATSAGRRLCTTARVVVDEATTAAFSRLDESERATLGDLLLAVNRVKL